MDNNPHFIQHNPRYTHLSPTPPPPRRPHFSDDPNFFEQSNYHQVPQLPPPEPLHLAPPPPPPQYPYNPSQTQIDVTAPNYRNHISIENDNPRSLHPLRQFTHSSRVPNRNSYEGNRPHRRFDQSYVENRSQFWEPSRFVADFDREVIRRQYDHGPFSPYRHREKVRLDSESSPRFRVEYSDGVQPNQREEVSRSRGDENYRSRAQFGSDSNSSYRNYGIVPDHRPLSRDNGLKKGRIEKYQYGPVRQNEFFGTSSRRDEVSENQRQIHGKLAARDVHDSLFMTSGSEVVTNDGEDTRIGKSGYYGFDLGRDHDSNRGIIEGNHEHNRTPKKHMQRKSALLRIQAASPNHWIREGEHLRNSCSFRGTGQVDILGQKTTEEEEAVELDVSFKSNTLIAKQILTTPSSVAVQDVDPNQKSEKFRKRLVDNLDLDSSGSRPNKLNMDTDDVYHGVANHPSSSDKDSKEVKEQITGSSLAKVSAAPSQPIFNVKSVTPGKNKVQNPQKGMTLDKNGSRTDSHKTSSSGIVKKKVVQRKAVKKVISPHVDSPNSEKTKRCDESVKADDPSIIPPITSGPDSGEKPSEEKSPSSGMDFVDVELKTCPDEDRVFPGNRETDKQVPALVTGEDGNEINSGKEFLPESQSKENLSAIQVGSLGSEQSGNDERAQDMKDTLSGQFDVLNSEKDVDKLLGYRLFNIDCMKQCVTVGQKGKELISEGGRSHDTDCSVEGKTNSCLLGFEESKERGSAVDKDNFADFKNLDGGVKSQEISPVTGFRDDTGQQLYPNWETLLENDIVEKQSSLDLSAGAGTVLCFPNSVEKGNNDDSVNAGFSVDVYEDLRTIVQTSDVPCNCSSVDSFRQQQSEDCVALSRVNGSRQKSPGSKISHQCNKEDESVTEKSIARTHSDIISSNDFVAEQLNSVNTELSLSLEDSSHAQIEDSGTRSVDFGIQPIVDGVVAKDGTSFMDKISKNKSLVSSDVKNDLIETSSQSVKKRKLSDSSSFLTCPVMEINEGPESSVTSSPEISSTSNDILNQKAEVLAAPSLDTPQKGSLAANTSLVTVLLDSNCCNKKAIDSVLNEDDSKLELDSPGPAVQFPCSSEIENENRRTTGIKGNGNINYMGVESCTEEQFLGHASEEQIVVANVMSQLRIYLESLSMDADKRSSEIEKESHFLPEVEDLHVVAKNLPFAADANMCSTMNSSDEAMGRLQLTVCSPVVSDVPDANSLKSGAKLQISSEKDSVDYEKGDKSVALSESKTSMHSSNINLGAGLGTESESSYAGKSIYLPEELAKQRINESDKKKQPRQAKGKTVQNHLSVHHTASKKLPFSVHGAKPRTWHRTASSSGPAVAGSKSSSSTSLPQGKVSDRGGKSPGSYIRKGNSLVRKSAPVAAQPQSPSNLILSASPPSLLGQDELKTMKKPQNQSDIIFPGTIPPCSGSELPYCSPVSSGACATSPSVEPNPDSCVETASVLPVTETNGSARPVGEPWKASDSHEDQNVSANLTDNHMERNVWTSSSNVKPRAYVRYKPNQLVAASNPCDPSVHTAEKNRTISSDGYYKKNKNQLIRAPLDSSKQKLATGDDILNSLGQQNGKRLSKVEAKAIPSKALVWTLHGSQSHENNRRILHQRMIIPLLFPWKRACWRSFVRKPVSFPNNGSCSLSTIRKLLQLRKRNMVVYTRSNNGFSLRKSKVLSVSGASLKWSKSIERRSKKVNEEVTRAVAAAERKKREQNGATPVTIVTTGGNDNSYDGPSSYLQSEKSAKKYYKPTKSATGNDDMGRYVRIGNGNKLVRNPKKRTRILANEKVRWSLHTARQRLARKRKYCQFFTRFGRCNKDDGKCPYIHDPSKIVVCTKFLNGLCTDPSCRLTHKVIPERMPDCSYFLQGICCNKNCAYRHVMVNPKASICEGFLRGYCADGDECRKKHSYVCPTFEATGTCPDGSKCKLHHPLKRAKGRKRKHSGETTNARGRYFGSLQIGILEPGSSSSEKQHPAQNDGCFHQGLLEDYICLNVSDGEFEGSNEPVSERRAFVEGDPLDIPLDDLDELTKPVRIMHRKQIASSNAEVVVRLGM